MSRKFVFAIVLSATLGGAIALVGYQTLVQQTPAYNSIQNRQEQVMKTVSSPYSETVPINLDFTIIAAKAVNSVVYIQSKYDNRTTKGYYHYQQGPSMATGSGVIISDDGYIVTNNHVVDNATEIEITLEDNRSYSAKVIGTDPTTDLALIKIEENNLDFIPYGDSDEVIVGQWVLAVGNPFNLTSTVTAGIVSAKARNIGILRENNNNLQIESFIQTDAAVNPGNSGGALINTTGNLVGINTAIASRTGSYTGYSFAVPVNLVKKVMDDLLEFGVVQRGLLGIQIRDVSAQLSKAENLHVTEGVYVAEVIKDGGAEDAGIKAKDVIIAINGKNVRNSSQLQELVALHRPGDQIEVLLLRDGNEKTIKATLHNTGGTTAVVEKVPELTIDGSIFEEVSDSEKSRLNIESGVKLTEVGPGKWQEAGIEEGFIITHIDKQKVTSVNNLRRIMANKSNERVIFLGVFLDGTKSYYSVDW
ncbi:MAG: deoxyribonuclease HsdR [Bacteroidetes bacterium]|nr:MAG: deoxyribonuclease HsdR [Bacteroidota bacterium]